MKNETKIIIGGAILTIVILIGAIFLLSNQATSEQQKLEKPLMGEEIPNQGQLHIPIDATHSAYNSNPPTSGWHYADSVAGAGIHETEVKDEVLVHSLEHGAVIVSYKPDLPSEDIEKVKKAFNAASGKKIMVPRANLDVPVALTSWGRLLKLQTIDETIIKEFIETNNDRAPEKAPI